MNDIKAAIAAYQAIATQMAGHEGSGLSIERRGDRYEAKLKIPYRSKKRLRFCLSRAEGDNPAAALIALGADLIERAATKQPPTS